MDDDAADDAEITSGGVAEDIEPTDSHGDDDDAAETEEGITPAEGEAAEGDAETEAGDDEEAEEDQDEHEKLLKPYLAAAKGDRKAALKALAQSKRDTDNRAAQMKRENDTLKAELAKAKAAPAKPEPPVDLDKHPEVQRVAAQLKSWSDQYDGILKEAAGIDKEVETLKAEEHELRGEAKRADDYEKEQLAARADRLKEKRERRLERKVELQEKARDLAGRYAERKEGLDGLRRRIWSEQEHQKTERDRREEREAEFGTEWEGALEAAFELHGIPDSQKIREYIDGEIGKSALMWLHASAEANGGVPKAINTRKFISAEMEKFADVARAFAGNNLQRLSKKPAGTTRVRNVAPTGPAARTTTPTTSRAPKTWDEHKRWVRGLR